MAALHPMRLAYFWGRFGGNQTVEVLKPLIHFSRLVFRAAKSAHEIDNQADHQNQTQAAAANGRSAKIKTATAEQQEQNHEQ